MKEKEIKQIPQTKRLKLGLGEWLTHYAIVFFLFFISMLPAPDIYKIYFTKTYIGIRSGEELIQSSVPWLILAIIFCFIQYQQLRFKEFTAVQTEGEFKEAVDRTQKELEWNIEKYNSNYVRAYRPWNWTGSFGEMVTIIRNEDKILINSICDPNSFSSVTAWGWNKKNIRTFINNLKDIRQGVGQILIDGDSMVVNEWTMKKILIRVFFYPFCLFLIYISIFMCIPSGKILLAMGGLIFGCAYVYWDIQALLLNKRLKDKTKKGKQDCNNP